MFKRSTYFTHVEINDFGGKIANFAGILLFVIKLTPTIKNRQNSHFPKRISPIYLKIQTIWVEVLKVRKCFIVILINY